MKRLVLILIIILSVNTYTKNNYGFSDDWSEISLQNGKWLTWLKSIYFADSLNGMIGYAKSIDAPSFFRTTDGGLNWEYVWSDSSKLYQDSAGKYHYLHKTKSLMDISYPDTSVFIAITSSNDSSGGAYILRSTDKGVTWSYTYMPPYTNIKHIQMRNKAEGIISSGRELILYTSDGGGTWDSLSKPKFHFSYEPSDIAFPDKDVIFVYVFNDHPDSIDERHLVRTFDLGKTWDFVELPNDINGVNIYFTDRYKGWIVGWRDNPDTTYSSVIYQTTDSGESWIKQMDTVNGRSDDYTNIEVEFYDENHGISIGYRNQLFLTSDGGKTWVDQCPNYNTKNHKAGLFYDAFYKSPEEIFVTSYSGILFHYQKGPVSVVERVLDFSEKLRCYPNPVTERARVRYSVEKPGAVRVELFDALGRKLSTPVDEVKNIGCYSFELDATRLPAGMYYIRAATPDGEFSEKMIKE